VDEKIRYSPHPLFLPLGGGEGGRGCKLYGPEDLLNKNMRYIKLIIKSIMNTLFQCKPLKQKSLLRYFARHFLF
jgi:hypothetical protein